MLRVFGNRRLRFLPRLPRARRGLPRRRSGESALVLRSGGATGIDLADVPAGRALDALEAALSVLALPETGLESSASVLGLCRANTQLGMAYTELWFGLRVLESKWEAMAHALAHDHEGADYQLGAASAMRENAEELRVLIAQVERSGRSDP
jgi:hypothetical protein